jgi:hypothetical protein
VGLAFVANLLMYVAFSIPPPPQGIYTVETATMFGQQLGATGDPYSLSPLTVDEIPFESPPTFADNGALVLHSLGVFADGDETEPSVSVLPSIQEAFTSTGYGLLFRFGFSALPPETALANFSCAGWEIEFTYLTS